MEKSSAPRRGDDPLRLSAVFSPSFPRRHAVAHAAALRSAGPDSPRGFPPGDGSGLRRHLCAHGRRGAPPLVHHLDVTSSFLGLNRCSVLWRWGVTFTAEPHGTWGSYFLPGSFAQPTDAGDTAVDESNVPALGECAWSLRRRTADGQRAR